MYDKQSVFNWTLLFFLLWAPINEFGRSDTNTSADLLAAFDTERSNNSVKIEVTNDVNIEKKLRPSKVNLTCVEKQIIFPKKSKWQNKCFLFAVENMNFVAQAKVVS